MEIPGYFEKNIVLPPDYCGQTAELSPLAAFTLFQAIASEHAEYTGVGNDAMAARGPVLADAAHAGGLFRQCPHVAGGHRRHLAGAVQPSRAALLP